MGIKVDTGLIFSRYTNNQRTAEVDGNTVAECLKHLVEQFPKLKLFDGDGELLVYIAIAVNGELAYPEKLNKPVKDGDELSIIPMIDGG